MRLLRFPQLKSEKNVPFTRQHIRRLQKAGTFPLPVPLGKNTTAYLEEEIDEWLTSRVAKRDAQQQRQEVPAAAELVQEPAPVVGVGSARGRHKPAPARSTPPPALRSLAISNAPEEAREDSRASERITVGSTIFERNDVTAARFGVTERTLNTGNKKGAPFHGE